jgi:hypothetical protein
MALGFKTTVKVKSGKKLILEGPVSWDETTTELFENIHAGWKDKEDLVQLFAIMYCKGDRELLSNAPASLIDEVVKAARYMVMDEFDWSSVPMPTKLLGKDVPKEIGSHAFGKAIQARSILTKGFETNISALAAIYIEDRSPFSMKNARELQQQIKKLPIKEVHPISFFYLSKLESSGSLLTRGLARLNRMMIPRTRRLVNLPR